MKNIRSIGVIGTGRMGTCIIRRLIDSKSADPGQVFCTTKHEETGQKAAKALGVAWAKNNTELVKDCDVIVLAVKPQNMEEVISEISRSVTKNKLIISIAASISTAEIEAGLPKGVAVIRAMPNTPSFVGAGITAICRGKHCAENHLELAAEVFSPLGKIVRVDERHMDAVTGLSGCGPAYVYVILESLTDGGIKVGLPRELATQLAAQTLMGAGQMLLQTGKHPAALKDEVTTPAGCTIDGLMELEEGKLRVTLIKAVVQATKRAKSLAKQARK